MYFGRFRGSLFTLPSKGNPHVRTRVDPVLKRFLQGYAVAHDTTTAKLVREVLGEWVYEKVGHTPSKRVDHTLHRLDLLSKNPVSETPCCRV